MLCHPVTAHHAVSPLEGFKAHDWVCFERALVVRDLFTGGVRTFFSTADAQHFRTRLYQHYGASGCTEFCGGGWCFMPFVTESSHHDNKFVQAQPRDRLPPLWLSSD